MNKSINIISWIIIVVMAALIIGCVVVLAPRFSEDSKVKKENVKQETRLLDNGTNKALQDRKNNAVPGNSNIQKQASKSSGKKPGTNKKVASVSKGQTKPNN